MKALYVAHVLAVLLLARHANANACHELQSLVQWAGCGERLSVVERDLDGPYWALPCRTIAVTDITDNERICTVTPNSFLTVEDAHDNRVVMAVQEMLPEELYRQHSLMLYLIILKNARASQEWAEFATEEEVERFAPLIDALPKEFNTPIHWDSDSLQLLRGTQASVAVKQQRTELKGDHAFLSINWEEALKALDLPAHELSFEEFKWAYSVWAARQTTCPVTKQGVDIGEDGVAIDIVEEVECISPVLLLSRYDVKNNVDVQVSDAVLLVSSAAIAAGQEVVIADMVMWNTDMLLFEGYVHSSSPARRDTYELGLSLDPSSQLYEWQKGLLEQRGLSSNQNYFLKAAGPIHPDLLFALRVLHLTIYESDDTEVLFEDKAASHQNDEAAISNLLNLCQRTLRKHETTLQEDRAAMEQPHHTREYMAAVLRFGEKKILKNTIGECERMLDELDETWNDRSMDIPTVTSHGEL